MSQRNDRSEPRDTPADPLTRPAYADERTGSTPADADERPGGTPAALDAPGALHRLLVDTVVDYAIFALDPAGHIVSWNAGAERLKGYAANEIIGRHFSTFYPPEDIVGGRPVRNLEEATREGRVEDEGWRLRKDGSRFWASVVITALRDEAGTLVGFGKVTRDMTDRHRAEDVLRRSEERFRLLVQSVRDYAIFMLDADGCIASWNEGAQRLKGYRADEIIGRHFSAFYPADDIAAGKPQWELRVATREGKYEEEGWRIRKDGTSFWASVLITALRGDDGTLIGFAKVTRDLTERRAAQERALADARRLAAAEAASRTKSEFLAAMSHELRTPINATVGYVELIAVGVGGAVTEQQAEYLSRIRRSQEHLLRIITDLLNYSRIEAGQVQYDLADVAIDDVVAAVLPMIEPQARAKEIDLRRSPCEEPLVARMDAGKTEQILLNLLSNAVKFTPARGRVSITCRAVDDRIAVTVTDTGPGIPQDQQAAIFEPFVQLGRSLKSGHEGTGLGLAISRDLARAMNGDVTVESTPRRGAAFTLLLPRASRS